MMGAGVCLAPKLLTWGNGPGLNASAEPGGSWPLEGLGNGAPQNLPVCELLSFQRYCLRSGHQPPLLRSL